MRKFRFPVSTIYRLVFLLLTSVYTIEASSQAINYDSLKKIVATSQSDKMKMEALLQLADFYSMNADSQYRYAVMAKDFAGKIKDRGAEAYAIGDISESYSRRGNYVKALSLGLQILKTFEELKDTVRIANTYNGLANIYSAQGNPGLAKRYYLKTFELAGAVGSYQNQLYGAMNVAKSYRHDMPDSALYYTKFAIRLVDEGKARWSRGGLLVDLAYTYARQGRYELADQMINEALITTPESDMQGICTRPWIGSHVIPR